MTLTRKALQDVLSLAQMGKPDVHTVLTRCNVAMNGHGIEAIWQGNDKPSCLYVNMGDTYARTIVHDDERGFQVMSWGDWLEERELAGHVYN